MSADAWFTIIAIVAGPIAAVSITLWRDRRDEVKRRKREILASLMRTRSSHLSAEHVGALNLVQLEFYGRKRVMEAYKQYVGHLAAPLPSVDQQERFFHQREDLFLDLLATMAADLGYRFDKHDLKSSGYTPQGWYDDEWLQRNNMRMLSQLLGGERALIVRSEPGSERDPFPPPPE